MSDAYRLTFLLPPSMLLLVLEGRHQPCLHGVVLTVRAGVVSIEGGARDAVLEQAQRFFRSHARKLPAFSRSATLETPRSAGGGRDGYMITVNSDVTIAPSSLEPRVGTALRLVENETAIAS